VCVWTYAALGVAAAIASAVLVAAVSIFSARMARPGAGNGAWFVVPTLVFTALPLAARLFSLMSTEHSWWTRSVEFAPFLIGFAAPVLLLLLAYAELGRRARRGVALRLPRPSKEALAGATGEAALESR